MTTNRWARFAVASLALVLFAAHPATGQTAANQPNILVIWGDDIGYWNISAYNQGMMGELTSS